MGTWYSDEKLERVLRNYPLLKAQAKVEEEQLKYLFPSCIADYSGEPHGTEISDSTGNYAVNREKWSDNMKRARAIAIALDALTEQESNFVDYMYFKQWRYYQIRLRLGVEKTKMFKIRREALDKIAKIILL